MPSTGSQQCSQAVSHALSRILGLSCHGQTLGQWPREMGPRRVGVRSGRNLHLDSTHVGTPFQADTTCLLLGVRLSQGHLSVLLLTGTDMGFLTEPRNQKLRSLFDNELLAIWPWDVATFSGFLFCRARLWVCLGNPRRFPLIMPGCACVRVCVCAVRVCVCQCVC